MSGSMLGLISQGPQSDPEVQVRRGELARVSASDVLNSTLAEGFSESPGPRMGRIIARGYVDQGDGTYAPLNATDDLGLPTGQLPPSPMVPLEVLKREYDIPGVLSFDKDTPQSVAQSLYDHKRAQMIRADTISRSENMLASGMASRFVASMIGPLADPVNLAAMFVPGVNEAAVARMLRVGAGASAGARAGVRALAGASAGAAGMAALEPLNYVLTRQERDDWTFTGALANVLLGTVAGAGIHSGMGALAERTRGLPDWSPARVASERFQEAPPEVQQAIARHAVAAQAEGRPVDAAAVLRVVDGVAPDPWRGATVVADAAGRPLRVFHGSPDSFEQFDSAFLGKNTEAVSNQYGHFFSADPATAERYAARADPVASFMEGISDELGEWDLREGVKPAEVKRAQLVLQHLKEIKRAVDDAVVEAQKAGAEPHAAIEDVVTKITGDAKAAKMFGDLLRANEDALGAKIGSLDFPEGANIRPSNVRLQNPLVFDFKGKERPTSFADLLEQARAEGRDGAVFRNVHDGGPMTDVFVVFDPENIRPSWAADAERLRDARAAARDLVDPPVDTAASEPPPPASRTGLAPPDPPPTGEPGAASKAVAEQEKAIAALDQQIAAAGNERVAERLKEFDKLVDEETRVDAAVFETVANCLVRVR